MKRIDRRTVVQNSHESRRKYWTTRLSVRSHRSLIRLLRTARFTRMLRCAHSFTRSRARGKVKDKMSHNDLVLSHSVTVSKPHPRVAFPRQWKGFLGLLLACHGSLALPPLQRSNPSGLSRMAVSRPQPCLLMMRRRKLKR